MGDTATVRLISQQSRRFVRGIAHRPVLPCRMPFPRSALACVMLLGLCGCSGTSTAPPPAPPLTVLAHVAAVKPAAVTKVLVFVEENHSLGEMRSEMANTRNLAGQFGYATHYTAIGHPSLPNYVAIAGGQSYGITDDKPPSVNGVHGTSVFGQALAAGKTAGVYVDGMTQNCATSSGGSDYAVKHNPWAYFLDERDRCSRYDVPISQLGAAITGGTLPNVGMVVPNLCNDAHDCPLSSADSWFGGWMAQIIRGPDWTSGHLVVVLTADEDDRSAGNTVLTVVMHPSQIKHVVTSPLTHYSLTRLYEDVVGAGYLFNAGSAPSMASAFGLPLK